MSDVTSIKRLLLDDGLEDLIALPEAAESCVREGLLEGEDESSLRQLMEVLVELVRAGEIQIWAGPAMEDEKFVNESEAEALLRDPEKYSWGSASDAERRVYYVNVENLYVPPDVQ